MKNVSPVELFTNIEESCNFVPAANSESRASYICS